MVGRPAYLTQRWLKAEIAEKFQKNFSHISAGCRDMRLRMPIACHQRCGSKSEVPSVELSRSGSSHARWRSSFAGGGYYWPGFLFSRQYLPQPGRIPAR